VYQVLKLKRPEALKIYQKATYNPQFKKDDRFLKYLDADTPYLSHAPVIKLTIGFDYDL